MNFIEMTLGRIFSLFVNEGPTTIYMIFCAISLCVLFQIFILRKAANKNQVKLSVSHFIGVYIFLIYIAFVYIVTGFGTIWDLAFYKDVPLTSEFFLIPFSTIQIKYFSSNTISYLLNIVMMVPFGFMIPLIWPRFRSLIKVMLTAALFALVIELSQLFNYRTTTIDDIIMNTLGAIVGYLVFLGAHKLLTKNRFKPSKESINETERESISETNHISEKSHINGNFENTNSSEPSNDTNISPVSSMSSIDNALSNGSCISPDNALSNNSCVCPDNALSNESKMIPVENCPSKAIKNEVIIYLICSFIGVFLFYNGLMFANWFANPEDITSTINQDDFVKIEEGDISGNIMEIHKDSIVIDIVERFADSNGNIVGGNTGQEKEITIINDTVIEIWESDSNGLSDPVVKEVTIDKLRENDFMDIYLKEASDSEAEKIVVWRFGD